MPETVMHKHTGRTGEVIAETEQFYWLKVATQGRPLTVLKEYWGPPMPKVGDVWVSVSAATEYRVLGVDEERKLYLIVPRADYANGGWPNPHDASVGFGKGVQTDADISGVDTVYVRALPEEGLTLKERLEDW